VLAGEGLHQPDAAGRIAMAAVWCRHLIADVPPVVDVFIVADAQIERAHPFPGGHMAHLKEVSGTISFPCIRWLCVDQHKLQVAVKQPAGR